MHEHDGLLARLKQQLERGRGKERGSSSREKPEEESLITQREERLVMLRDQLEAARQKLHLLTLRVQDLMATDRPRR